MSVVLVVLCNIADFPVLLSPILQRDYGRLFLKQLFMIYYILLPLPSALVILCVFLQSMIICAQTNTNAKKCIREISNGYKCCTTVQQHTTARLEYSRVQPGRKLLLAEQVFSHLNSTCLLLGWFVNQHESTEHRCVHTGHEMQTVCAQGFPIPR